MIFPDRRRALRLPFAARTSVTDVKSDERMVALTRDLSLQGCFVATQTPSNPGTPVWITIYHAGAKVAAIGKVVHVGREGMGVAFSKMDLRDQLHIDRWMSLLRANWRPGSLIKPYGGLF